MTDNIFIFEAVYDTVDDAKADYEGVKALHAGGLVGTYDAAVISKDDAGKVHVHKDELPTRHGAWSGLGVGALIGILFPPSLIASSVVGATAGGLIGHLWKGMSRGDMKELGEQLDDGAAALVVIGESKIKEAIEKEIKRATKAYEKAIDADAKKLRAELDESVARMLT
jgi:uncharacterized membrane protein